MATKLTPAQLAALDFLIAVGKQRPPAAAPATPAASTAPAAEATTAAPGAAAGEKPVSIGGKTTPDFLDDIVDFVGDVGDAVGDAFVDAFNWDDAVSAFEDLAEHLVDDLDGLPVPVLEELGVRDPNGAVVPPDQIKAMRKRPLSVNDLIALRDAQRKL